MSGARDWADFKASDFAAVDADTTLAVLPVAAVEQHGPHLPLGTDTMIAEGMINHLKQICPDDLDLRLLPIQAIGKSNEHLWAAGTLTLTAETALRAWTEIGHSVARAGIRKLAVINSHGGNRDIVGVLARELRVEHGMIVFKGGWGHSMPEGMFGEREMRFGIHGGDYETSLMLAFRPDLVDMSKAEDFRSSGEETPLPPASYGWIASDLNPKGALGDATAATAEKGRVLVEHAIGETIEALRALKAMSLPKI